MITKTQAVDINIQDVGAIKDLTVPIQRGTIVKLKGMNGSGKSTGITALTSAITKENVGLKPRDGKMSGKVRLPGATVTFGAKLSKKPTGDETVSFAIVEDGTGITKILKPNLKDAVAADKKRLEGVLDVIGAELSDDQMKAYLGDMYVDFLKSRDVKGKGFVDAVKEMKLYLEGKAREVNVSLTQCDGAIAEIGVIETVEVGDVSAEDLGKQVETLAMEVRDAKRDRKKADEAAQSDDGVPGADIEKLRSDLQTLQLSQNEAIMDSNELQHQIDELTARKKEIDNQAETRMMEIDGVVKQIGIAVEAESRIANLKKLIALAPTAEEIETMETNLDALRGQHTEAIRVKAEADKTVQKRARLAELQKQREEHDKKHAKLKALAIGTGDLLKEALKVVPGWTVNEDLRLCVQHSRGEIPFSELSPGEGTARVCLLACQFAECGEDEIPVIGLPQELFEGLDGMNIQLLMDAVAENQLCIVTAECDKSKTPTDLRVEVMAD